MNEEGVKEDGMEVGSKPIEQYPVKARKDDKYNMGRINARSS